MECWPCCSKVVPSALPALCSWVASSLSLPLVFQEGAQQRVARGGGHGGLRVVSTEPWTPRVGWLATAAGHLLPVRPRQAQGGHRPHAVPVFRVQWEGGRSWAGGEASSALREAGPGPLMPGSIWEGFLEVAALGQVLESKQEFSRQRGRGRGRSVSKGPAGLGARAPTASSELREAGPGAREAGCVPGRELSPWLPRWALPTPQG